MTDQIIRKANKNKYKESGKSRQLGSAAQLLMRSRLRKLPIENDPGPYVLGVGDQFIFEVVSTGDHRFFKCKTVTADDGFVSLLEIEELGQV